MSAERAAKLSVSLEGSLPVAGPINIAYLTGFVSSNAVPGRPTIAATNAISRLIKSTGGLGSCLSETCGDRHRQAAAPSALCFAKLGLAHALSRPLGIRATSPTMPIA
jgi:hypothetical protein